jgi:hypothetical protein
MLVVEIAAGEEVHAGDRIVAAMREAVRRAVERGTLRSAARSIDVSPSTLNAFLNGANPHGATRRKLSEWMVRTSHLDRGREADTARAAVEFFVSYLHRENRPDARRALVQTLREFYAERSVVLPRWIERLPPERP